MEGIFVAEKTGNVNQNVAVKLIQFAPVLLDVVQVIFHLFEPVQHHTALNTPLQGHGFIKIEVHPGRLADQGQQLLHVGAGADDRGFFFCHRYVGDVGVPANTGKFLGDILGIEYEIDAPGRDSVVGHAGVLGRSFTLGKRDSTRRLDQVTSSCTIGGGARENDTDGLVVALVGQRLKELVDRHVHPAGEGPGA